jgi:hypothetical protein
VWKNHFAPWAENAEATALAAAHQHFRPIATDVLNRRRTELRRDRERLQDWLESRTREIIAVREPDITTLGMLMVVPKT